MISVDSSYCTFNSGAYRQLAWWANLICFTLSTRLFQFCLLEGEKSIIAKLDREPGRNFPSPGSTTAIHEGPWAPEGIFSRGANSEDSLLCKG